MHKKNIWTKFVIIIVLALSFSPAITFGYSYFDALNNNQSGTVSIGEWWGTPITTPQEFYNFATKIDSTANDIYYLENDLDFSGFNWAITSTNFNVTFRGLFNGNGHTISNLTITSNPSFNSYLGIFPRMEGGTVTNVTFSNVNLVLDSTSLVQTATKSGLISADVYGLTNQISNITLINCGVRGTSVSGTGGLIGSVQTGTSVLNVSNIKATGLRVFSTDSSSGGIIGAVLTAGASITVSDIDIQGEVTAMGISSYTGGVIGQIFPGALFNLQRAVVEMTSQNTLETNASYYLMYSQKYLGGFIGYNQSSSTQVFITNSFFTGGLVTNDWKNYTYVGTAIGRSTGSETISNAFYSMVLFRDKDNTIRYDVILRSKGVMATVVDALAMPTISWWNGFASPFLSTNSLWQQNSSTGRLELIR